MPCGLPSANASPNRLSAQQRKTRHRSSFRLRRSRCRSQRPVAVPVAGVEKPPDPQRRSHGRSASHRDRRRAIRNGRARRRARPRARHHGRGRVRLGRDASRALLFDDCRDEASREVAVVRTEPAVPAALWLIGDIHADVLTLANIIAYTESKATPGQPAHFLLLGDFVDRGVHDHETLLLLFGLMMTHPERVCVVPGNHDIDLQFVENYGRFKVTIEPAEYCEALNASVAHGTADAAERAALAKAFIRFCAGPPEGRVSARRHARHARRLPAHRRAEGDQVAPGPLPSAERGRLPLRLALRRAPG